MAEEEKSPMQLSTIITLIVILVGAAYSIFTLNSELDQRLQKKIDKNEELTLRLNTSAQSRFGDLLLNNSALIRDLQQRVVALETKNQCKECE